MQVQLLKSDRDKMDFTHTCYNATYKGVIVFNKMIIAYCQNGKMVTLNGDLNEIKVPANNFSLSEKNALNAPVAVTASVGGLNVTASAPSTLICEGTGTMMLTGSPVGGTFSGRV